MPDENWRRLGTPLFCGGGWDSRETGMGVKGLPTSEANTDQICYLLCGNLRKHGHF